MCTYTHYTHLSKKELIQKFKQKLLIRKLLIQKKKKWHGILMTTTVDTVVR